MAKSKKAQSEKAGINETVNKILEYAGQGDEYPIWPGKAAPSKAQIHWVLRMLGGVVGYHTATEHVTVTLPGLGSWSYAHSEARKGRNPKTGKSIQIKAHGRVRFKPSESLKRAFKNG